MKYLRLFLVLLATIGAMSIAAVGQDGPPPDEAMHDDRPGVGRPNLFAELGLSRDQIQQIRRMNQGRRPAMQEAQRRLRIANRDLDMAIYGDAVSDAEFQTRLKEFQTAQAEVTRLRFESELSVRKVLTPEQLIHFRELRRRFAEERRDGQPRRRGGRPGDRPPLGDRPMSPPIQ